MKNMKTWKTTLLPLMLLGLVPASAAFAATGDMETLESQLDDLALPSNVAPATVTTEKLYSVQDRYSNLSKRLEVTLGGGQNFTGSSFLRMRQADLTLRYHLSNRWDLAASGSMGSNELTGSAERLLEREGILPDAAYVKNRADLLLGYHLFYGKFRLSMDKVLYFDQYIAIGPGLVMTQYGTAPSGVADIGLVFWPGSHMTVRFGFKNIFFNEKRMASSSTEHHLLGHLDVGYTFGDGT